ncbi:CWF19-like protein 2 [Pocillopora damicornis]|uniref:CWF19-like protein 2 n=1 Tax=Pocillopora damicornis TaxID=46731 RepID=UPI000F54F408|nr:CWF19-like protein 2 [Pocillopora damicornis]
MADLINFISKREIDAKKEETRKAREQILKKAKGDYEREQWKKQKRIESGETSWMLPSLSNSLTVEDDSHNDKDKSKKKKHRKEKKQKKDKKEKKHKKQKKDTSKENMSSDSESGDEWVEKETTDSVTLSKPGEVQVMQQQRDSWMLCPPVTSSSQDPVHQEEEEDKGSKDDEETEALSCIDRPGQHAKELNPYWRDGGTGLPSERKSSQDTHHKEGNAGHSFSSAWLKRAYQRAKDEAEEEGKKLADIVAKRYGSVQKLEAMIKEAEDREEKLRGEESRKRDRERYRGDREGRDDRHRDRDKEWRRNRDRSPMDRYSRDNGKTYRSTREEDENKWRRRPEQEETGRERPRDDTNRFARPGDFAGDNRSSFVGKFKRPGSSTSTPQRSSTWDFDSNKNTIKERHSYDRPSSSSSGGWRKKPDIGTEKGSPPLEVKRTEDKESVPEVKLEPETDSSSSSEEEVEEKKPVVIPAKKITEKDLNDIGAKIVKAEIMGNEDLATKLKAQLEEMRKNKKLQEAQVEGSSTTEEQMVLLTRTDATGNVWPVEMTAEETRGGRKKRRKVATHGKEGKRERYFADDDNYDLKEMVRREKTNSGRNDPMMAKMFKTSRPADQRNDHQPTVSPINDENEFDVFCCLSFHPEHRQLAAQLARCRFCFENPDIAKHLIIAIGLKVYLALPLHESLTEGHCLIIPMQHCSAATMLDEDVWSEIQIYKKGLTRMFEEKEEDVVFIETHKQLRKQHHMIIECIPLPKEVGDMSPVYFKKAILESDTEWAQNVKLVDTRKKGLRVSIPKGLPYFSVEFGLDGGFAHVIEDEALFPLYFGKEIIGGMLDLEPQRWRNPRRENFEHHKRKVLQFADWWKPYDWTRKIERD